MDELLSALLRALAFGTPLLLASLGASSRAGRGGQSGRGGHDGAWGTGGLRGGLRRRFTGQRQHCAGHSGGDGGGRAGRAAARLRDDYSAGQPVCVGAEPHLAGPGRGGLLGKKYEGFPLPNQPNQWPFIIGAIVLALGLAFWLTSTQSGLTLRSVGENPAAADVLGLNVNLIRYGAVAFGGALSGLAGAYLSLVYRPRGADGMTAGLGLDRGGAGDFRRLESAAGHLRQHFLRAAVLPAIPASGQNVYSHRVFAAMPYLLVILVLAFAGLRGQQGAAPGALGRPYTRRRTLNVVSSALNICKFSGQFQSEGVPAVHRVGEIPYIKLSFRRSLISPGGHP